MDLCYSDPASGLVVPTRGDADPTGVP